MSNHLHELLDLLEDEFAPIFPYRLSNETCDAIQKLSLIAARQATCFYAGNFTDLASNFKVIDELVRLPFDASYIEVKHDDIDRGTFLFGHLLWNDGDYICAQTWRKYQGTWSYLFSWSRISPGKLRIAHCNPRATAVMIQSTILQVTLFLSALNCTNVKQIENIQPIKLQAARMKRGKKPLFNYRTLYIDLPSKENARDASVNLVADDRRLHLCRGHIKRRKTGYFWWQAHIRGNKKNGFVHKDYSAKYPTEITRSEIIE
jgi:hypothetical protein